MLVFLWADTFIFLEVLSAKTSQRSSPIMHRFKAKLVDPYMCVKAKLLRCSPTVFLPPLSHARFLITEILFAWIHCKSSLAGILTATKTTRWMLAQFAIGWQFICPTPSANICIHWRIDDSCNLYIWVHSTVQIKSDSATQTIVLALLEILNKQQQEQQSPRRTLQHYGKKHMNNRGNKQSTKSS